MDFNFLDNYLDQSQGSSFSQNVMFLAQLATRTLNIIGISKAIKINENISWKNIVTKNPIENGQNVVDNIVSQGLMISQDFIVSVLANDSIAGIPVISPILKLLVDMRESKTFTTVFTSYGIFRNMIIESLDVKDINNLKNTIECKITFIEVQIAKTKSEYSVKTGKTKYENTISTKNAVFNKASQATSSTGFSTFNASL